MKRPSDGRLRARRVPALLGSGVLVPALFLACSASDEPSQPDFHAPPTPDVRLTLEPRVLHIGEIVTAEVTVLTPADYRVLPIVPVEIPGLALLGVRTLAPEHRGERWLHRTRIRLRPLTLGAHEWPAGSVEIEDTDGNLRRLETPAQSFEITSLRDRFPDREEPFGLEEPTRDETSGFGGFGFGVAAGVTGSFLAALGAWRLRRRAERRTARDVPGSEAGAEARSEPTAADLFVWTDRELREALEVVETDPQQAASAGAHLLRVYMARRFGSETEASTTEELARLTPALAEQSVWPDFVRILNSFDDERFRPARSSAHTIGAEAGRIRAALEDTRRLVQGSNPSTHRDASKERGR